ncbi:LacI family DNA-binding transcriptional regulator [Aerosticca soli]|uniref:LacI family DNA-binding transcriptional regulator n=1 Tax=Aerosticca soli TaxID=2010829 RepID=UPI000F820EFE|nr:LacI family DNA-binding transcriptional regulator [Aerosticca soli]
MVTIRDVAREAGVSVASVSRALNGHGGVTAETAARIRQIAAQLRYVPDMAARSLITRRTHTIGVLLPDLYGEFFSELIRGIDLAARPRGLHLLVSSSHGDVEEAALAMRAMQGRVDGMLILSPWVDAAFLQANLPAGLPVVLLNSALESGEYGVLNLDNYGGAYAMTRHLIAARGSAVAFIGGPAANYDARQREAGYRDALAAFAPGTAPCVLPGEFTEDSGYRAGLALLALPTLPQAVFAANDMMALGCLHALRQAGLNVPQDMGLAGFDDIPIARYLDPPLTTVEVRIAEWGRCALETLVARLDGPPAAVPEDTLFAACRVRVRGSCGATTATASTGSITNP